MHSYSAQHLALEESDEDGLAHHRDSMLPEPESLERPTYIISEYSKTVNIAERAARLQASHLLLLPSTKANHHPQTIRLIPSIIIILA